MLIYLYDFGFTVTTNKEGETSLLLSFKCHISANKDIYGKIK